MKQIFLFISLAVLVAGLYMKFFYDVPDSQENINFFVSWFLIITGVASFLINIFWQTPTKSSNNPE
jgi:RsiW-degrading membrane proteinase PrsW (M82 family)